MSDIATAASNGLVPTNIGEAVRLAEFMSRARMVPKHLQDSPGDCLMIIEQAMRWGMSPFAVAQATSVISGKMMYEGKLVASAVENSGAIVGHLDYTFTGDGDARTVTVSATRRGETNPRTVDVAFKDARTGNDMWKRQPDQQLVYHGARVWARRWTPAVILGVYSREEMGQVIEGEIVSDDAATPRFPSQESPSTSPPMKAAAAPTRRGERKVAPPVQVFDSGLDLSPLDEPNGPKWLINLELLTANAQTDQEMLQIGDHDSVRNVGADPKAPDHVKQHVSKLLSDGYKRVVKPIPRETPDDLHIEGEHLLAAG